MSKVNNRNTRAGGVICLKLTIKTPEQHHLCRSGVFIVNFEHISHLVLVILLLTFSRQMQAGYESLPRNSSILLYKQSIRVLDNCMYLLGK